MAKGILRILMVIALLIGVVACGSSGVDNGISPQVNQSGQGQDGPTGKDPGPIQR
jgi:hypothetical protein